MKKKYSTFVLEQAKDIVYARAEQQYGHPRNDFKCIATCWTAYLQKKGVIPEGEAINERDVALMMIQLKVARDANKPGFDNTCDIAGYAECAERVAPADKP